MIKPEQLFNILKKNNLNFFTGVPDSTLKDFCFYIADNKPDNENIITPNEGNAIALAAGYHFSTGMIATVFMQNSGLGNCFNPLTSLIDPNVYSVPMLLIIGWRGEPDKKDEPQHVKMGEITKETLSNLGIPYAILPESINDAKEIIKEAKDHMNNKNAPFALIVKKNSFEKYVSPDNFQNKNETNFSLKREDAIRIIMPLLNDSDIIISTTGKTSRELFELRETNNQGHHKDFLTVGSMGHSSSIALGVALQKPNRTIYCFDGDGALIMHMGILSLIGKLKPKNYKHIIFNNFTHDSVGGQPTAADTINIPTIAKANGYKEVFTAKSENKLKTLIKIIKEMEGPVLLEVKINKGSRKDLGRPTRTPIQNKLDFMSFLKND